MSMEKDFVRALHKEHKRTTEPRGFNLSTEVKNSEPKLYAGFVRNNDFGEITADYVGVFSSRGYYAVEMVNVRPVSRKGGPIDMTSCMYETEEAALTEGMREMADMFLYVLEDVWRGDWDYGYKD